MQQGIARGPADLALFRDDAVKVHTARRPSALRRRIRAWEARTTAAERSAIGFSIGAGGALLALLGIFLFRVAGSFPPHAVDRLIP